MSIRYSFLFVYLTKKKNGRNKLKYLVYAITSLNTCAQNYCVVRPYFSWQNNLAKKWQKNGKPNFNSIIFSFEVPFQFKKRDCFIFVLIHDLPLTTNLQNNKAESKSTLATLGVQIFVCTKFREFREF